MSSTNFANTITELRKRKGISQKIAANELGISQALLSHYENGIRECGLDFVLRVADYYGVSCDYLLGNSNSAVRFDVVEKLTQVPEDKEMCINTLYRASALLGAKFFKNNDNSEKMQNIYAIAAYLLVLKGVEAGYVPHNWIGDNIPSRKQVEFLVMISNSILNEIDKAAKPAKFQEAPECVKTISKWANEFLNANLADLIV
ncbi:MAG: helix-turn-helix transcriptional regulator [Oscillospiraceae bacterium]